MSILDDEERDNELTYPYRIVVTSRRKYVAS